MLCCSLASSVSSIRVQTHYPPSHQYRDPLPLCLLSPFLSAVCLVQRTVLFVEDVIIQPNTSLRIQCQNDLWCTCGWICVAFLYQDIDWVQTEKHVFEQASNHPFLVGLHSCFQTESRWGFVLSRTPSAFSIVCLFFLSLFCLFNSKCVSVFQTLLCNWIRKWRRSHVPHAKTTKTSWRTRQVETSSEIVLVLTQYSAFHACVFKLSSVFV